jgi:hypothetical protein
VLLTAHRVFESATTPAGSDTSLDQNPVRATLSGAHVRPVSTEDAAQLLKRLGLSTSDRLALALGALDDNGGMVGVLATGPWTAVGTNVWVAVTPERRRLKVGTDLVDTLIADHAGVLSALLVFRHPANCPISTRFVRSTGLHTRRLAPVATMVTLS